MESALVVLCGSLVAGGIYLLLSRQLVRMLFGLVMLSNAVNLIIFTAGGLGPVRPPLIEAGRSVLAEPVANALPQALILTAVVIGFALLTFMFVLFYRGYQALGTAEPDRMRAAEPDGTAHLPAQTDPEDSR